MTTRCSIWVGAAVLSLFRSISSRGQAQATIVGTVLDPTGAAIVGAEVLSFQTLIEVTNAA